MRTESNLRFELFNSDQRSEVNTFLSEWQRLVEGQDNHYLQYQSPAWWEHLCATEQEHSIFVLRVMQGDKLIGVVPLQRKKEKICLLPSTSRFASICIPVVEVLGGQPLMPEDASLVARMFEFLFEQWAGISAVYFKSVPQTSKWYDLLVKVANDDKACFPLITREETFHYLTLPSSFDGFLQRFTKKKRYNLKRQLRLIEDAYTGKLRLECITSTDGVDAFLEASSVVAAASWKEISLTRTLEKNTDNHAKYTDVAKRGLFRSYVLRDGERPVAYVLGYQWGDIYHYSDVAYAESESYLSPGIVLLFLIIRDLIESTSTRQINFGVCDADYKRQFADQHTRDRSLLVFRLNLRNQLLRAVHAISATITDFIKKIVRNKFFLAIEYILFYPCLYMFGIMGEVQFDFFLF
jgi:CelD/BcsL family acetyltransferase involved in cellulose biosynthesis